MAPVVTLTTFQEAGKRKREGKKGKGKKRKKTATTKNLPVQ